MNQSRSEASLEVSLPALQFHLKLTIFSIKKSPELPPPFFLGGGMFFGCRLSVVFVCLGGGVGVFLRAGTVQVFYPENILSSTLPLLYTLNDFHTKYSQNQMILKTNTLNRTLLFCSTVKGSTSQVRTYYTCCPGFTSVQSLCRADPHFKHQNSSVGRDLQ